MKERKKKNGEERERMYMRRRYTWKREKKSVPIGRQNNGEGTARERKRGELREDESRLAPRV